MARGHDLSSGLLARASGSEEIDPLSDVLRAVRLTGALFFVLDASSPWVAAIPSSSGIGPVILPGAQHVVSFHVVLKGRCWAGLDDVAGTGLEAGDLLLVPGGDPYVMSNAPGTYGGPPLELALSFFRHVSGRQALSTVSEGGGGPERASLVCGFLGCDMRPFNPVLAALPRLVHLRPPKGPEGDRLGYLIEFALAESREKRAGSDCVLLRISELMFVEVVRRYLGSLPPEEMGWLAGLRDPVIGRALGLLHQRPAHPWTLEELAKEAGLSRSVMAERFTRFVGLPPMQYLARWRIQLAAKLLADGAAKVSAVAIDVGYDSEAAFSRAFKRAVGVPPAAWRERRARPG